MRFLGNIDAKTDVKGRVFFPASFRKILQGGGEETMVLRLDVFQKCLVLYPESVWNEQMDMLRQKLNRWDRRQQMLYRQFVTNIVMVTLDGNGRFLIPGKFRKESNIGQEVSFVGLGDTIEVWNPQSLEESMLSQEQFSDEIEAIMTDKPES